VYERAADRFARHAARHHVPVWRTDDRLSIPADGWYDEFHLNSEGAAVFSRWLGERLAAEVEGRRLPHPDARAARAVSR
jgi:hypothetical protein